MKIRTDITPLFALVVAAVLLNTTVSGDDATPAMVAVTGPSFGWTLVQKSLGEALTSPFQTDFSDAVKSLPGVTVKVQSLSVNATALFVTYTSSGSATPDAIRNLILASQLPSINDALDKVRNTAELADYLDLLPLKVLPNANPLLPDPNGGGDDTLPVLSTQTDTEIIFLSGESAAWEQVMAADSADVSTAVSQAALTALTHSNVLIDCKVTGMKVSPADSTLRGPGDGRGGLYVYLTVTQNMTQLSRHPYNALELVGVLSAMDTSTLTSIYQTQGKPNVMDAVTVLVMNEVAPEKCGSLCIGMSVMGGVIVVLMLVVFLITTCVVCCPCCIPAKFRRRHRSLYTKMREPDGSRSPLTEH